MISGWIGEQITLFHCKAKGGIVMWNKENNFLLGFNGK